MATYINVPVPEHLVPAVMALISAHMAPKEAPPTHEKEPVVESAPAAASSDWTEAELRKLWNDSGPQMRKVLAKLAEKGGIPVPGDDLAKVVGKEKKGHTIAGMMGALGRRIKHRHKGRWPFSGQWNADVYRWEYTMPKAVAEIVLKFVPAPK